MANSRRSPSCAVSPRGSDEDRFVVIAAVVIVALREAAISVRRTPEWRYASIHTLPVGGATISSASFRSTCSKRTGVPRISVINGHARFSSSIVSRPARCSDSP